MTSTCATCNHELGSSIDAPFVDSMFGRFRSFKLSTEDSNGVMGFRRYRNVRFGPGEEYEKAVWIDGDKNSNMHLAGATEFEFKAQAPDPTAVNLGELKSLYLACCVIAGEVISGETAERVRADLVAVRDDRDALAHLELVDVAQWTRHIRPFEAEVRKPEPQPILQGVVARDECLIPAVGWESYTCEEPFQDSPELSATLEVGVRLVEQALQAET